jgi:HK97 family phage major capsid protein
LHRSERERRVRQLERWFDEQNAEFDGDAFPPEVQDAWDANTRELEQHRAVLAELDERDAHLRELSLHPSNREHGSDRGHGRRNHRELPGHIRASMDTGLRTIERHQDTLSTRAADALETMVRSTDPHVNAMGFAGRYLDAVADPDYLMAFTKLVADPQSGHLRMTHAEVAALQHVNEMMAERVMNVGTGSAGGFAIPFTLDPTVMLTSSGSVNPIRDLADVEMIATDQWKGVSADTPTAAYAAELTEASDNSPTLVQPIADTQKGQAFIPVSIELSQDWATLQTEMSRLLNDARDQVDATKFLSGVPGSSEPVGILAIGQTGALTTTQRVLTAATNNVAIADVYSLSQAVPPRFYPRATWLFNRSVGDVFYRFVASGSTTEPPIFPEGRNGPLLGKPQREWSTMASTGASGNRIALLGDFSGYKVVDRIGATIEVIPHLFGATNRCPIGARGFYFYWRTGTVVQKPNALRYLELK